MAKTWRWSWIICSKLAYLRPNLLHMGKLVLIPLFLLILLARRSGGRPAGARAPIDVLLFLFGWFEDLRRVEGSVKVKMDKRVRGSSHLEGAEQTFINAHHRSSIIKFTAVVRCTEQCHQLALGEELISVLHDLVRTAYQVHIMFLQEA